MAKRNPLKGVSSKEQKMYEDIKEKAEKDNRYGSEERNKEVAARTVMKYHKQHHHKKGE